MVIGVVLASFGMFAAEKEIARTATCGGRDAIRYSARQRTEQNVYDPLMNLGIAADARARMGNIENASRRRDDLDRAVTSRIARNGAVRQVEHRIVGGGCGHPIGAVARTFRLRTGT